MRVALTLLLALAALPAAQASEALSQKHSCSGCHQVDAKMVGPSYKEIAAKYKGQAGAADALAKKVAAGGTGVWGNVPMPPMGHVGEADTRALVAWILER